MKYLTKRTPHYSRMTASVAEKLWSQKKEMENNLIPWDKFTTDWVLDKLPKPNTIEERIYKERRANYWVKDINFYFKFNKYPCHLSVKHTVGVKLETDKAASHRFEFRTHQHDLFIDRSTGEFDMMLQAPFPPKDIKLMTGFNQMYRGLNQILELIKVTPPEQFLPTTDTEG